MKKILLSVVLAATMGAASAAEGISDEEFQFLNPDSWRQDMVNHINTLETSRLCKGKLIETHFPRSAKVILKEVKFQNILAKRRIREESINCNGSDITPLGKQMPKFCTVLNKVKDHHTSQLISALFGAYDNARNAGKYGWSDRKGIFVELSGAGGGVMSYEEADNIYNDIGCNESEPDTTETSTGTSFSGSGSEDSCANDFFPDLCRKLK